jgi:hypothetical protein
MSRGERLAMSRDSRARREVERKARRRIDGVLPLNARGLTSRLIACELEHVPALLAECRGLDAPLAPPVPSHRLLKIAAERMAGRRLSHADQKYLERQIATLNPSRPIAVLADGPGVEVGAIAHTSATSAAVASFPALPSAAGYPAFGRAVGHEHTRPVIELEVPNRALFVAAYPDRMH